jgi:hypothetical protein
MARVKAEGRESATQYQTPYHWAAAYGVAAASLLLVGRWGQPPDRRSSNDLENSAAAPLT